MHRNYEALLVETVPINKATVIKQLFEYYGLPGEFVDSWSILSEEYLRQLLDRNYNTEKVSGFLEIEKHTQSIKNTKD